MFIFYVHCFLMPAVEGFCVFGVFCNIFLLNAVLC